MMNYIIWRDENNKYELLIEVFNSSDVLSVQKQFVNKGYIVTECFDTRGSSFIRCYKPNEEGDE